MQDIFQVTRATEKQIETEINKIITIIDETLKDDPDEWFIFVERATPLTETAGLLPIIMTQYSVSFVDNDNDWFADYELFQHDQRTHLAHYLKGRCLVYSPTTLILSKENNDDKAYCRAAALLVCECNKELFIKE